MDEIIRELDKRIADLEKLRSAILGATVLELEAMKAPPVNSSSKTTVVNVKVGFIRPKYQDLGVWMRDEQNVYIGRRGIVFIDKRRFPEQDSFWANPFKVGKDGERDEVIEKYRKYIVTKQGFKEELKKLKGKTLGCWCKPEACHGDVLVELLEEK